jgi:hypothetical protein
LPTIRGGKGMTPLYMAALLGQFEMADFLYSRTKEMLEEPERQGLFFTCVDNGLYGKCTEQFILYIFQCSVCILSFYFFVNYADLAMKMLERDKALAKACNVKRETALHILARMPSEFVTQSPGMWNRLINSCEFIL